MGTGFAGVQFDERGLITACPWCDTRNRLAYNRLGETFRCGGCKRDMELPAEPIEMHSEADFRSIAKNAAIPLLVDFWAPWCGPCKMVAPELIKVAATSQGAFLVLKVNTEELPITAQQFRISTIPTLVLMRYGRELARKSGALPAAAIRQFMSQFSG